MKDKEVIWLHGEVKTPPFSVEARLQVGVYLRQLQQGILLSMPHSRPMPSIGARCHELRVPDRDKIWRILYRIDQHAILVAEVFAKKTQATPQTLIAACAKRLQQFDEA